MVTSRSYTYRILAVDDEQGILDVYKSILAPDEDEDIFSDVNAKAIKLFGKASADDNKDIFELVTCRQGDEAVKQVKEALVAGKPFSVAFLDVRMPPGPDGAWVARQIHGLDPSINIVIVTAYSDVPPQEIARSLKTPARLFYIQKPFHWDEIHQFATALSENWKIQEELIGNFDLFEKLAENQVSALSLAQQDVLEVREKLSEQTQHVEDVNTALRVLLGEKERDKKNIEENITFNFNEHVAPYLLKLEKTELTERQKFIVSTIEKNLKDIVSSFSQKIATKRLNFTPIELQVANLIKHGNSTKEIAEMLHLSNLTIESYRKNIRKKMGLTNSRENLRTHLLEYI